MIMDIEFGKLQHSTPQLGLRPDQDGQYVIATVGSLQSEDLAIYVDLDVMRELEAHASSNTRVELGGVLLGYQRIDCEGAPFVVITDCLRAEHYQATRGSFKFTHETWSQITRDRAQFKPELEMVGWYHTHPGWSVFLSGMDLFICDNFFNRPLDVALVIDPCQGDRGWFYWASSKALPVDVDLPTTLPPTNASDDPLPAESVPPLRTGGFYLTTGRFRNEELQYFANQYSPPMNRDPRYSPNALSPSAIGHTMINLTDQRKPVFELALASMLLAQFVLLAVVCWKLVTPPSSQTTDSIEVAKLKEQAAELETRQRAQIEHQAQQEILQTLVEAKDGSPDFVKRYSDLSMELAQTKSNLSAQIALSEQLRQSQRAAAAERDEKIELNERLSSQLQTAREQLNESRQRTNQLLTQLKSEGQADPSDSSESESITPKFKLPWWATLLSALGVLAAGVGIGFLFGKSQVDRDELAVDPGIGQESRSQ